MQAFRKRAGGDTAGQAEKKSAAVLAAGDPDQNGSRAAQKQAKQPKSVARRRKPKAGGGIGGRKAAERPEKRKQCKPETGKKRCPGKQRQKKTKYARKVPNPGRQSREQAHPHDRKAEQKQKGKLRVPCFFCFAYRPHGHAEPQQQNGGDGKAGGRPSLFRGRKDAYAQKASASMSATAAPKLHSA